MPIADASGTGLFHLGEAISEAAVVSLSSVISSKTSYVAGKYLREHLNHALAEATQADLSDSSLNQIMQTLSFDTQQAWKLEVVGKDRVTGRPSQLTITHTEVEKVIDQVFAQWLEQLEWLFQRIPPAVTTDIMDKGLLLSGGLAQLQGLEMRLAASLNVPVSTVEQPSQVVVNGLGTALDNLELFKESIGYQEGQ